MILKLKFTRGCWLCFEPPQLLLVWQLIPLSHLRRSRGRGTKTPHPQVPTLVASPIFYQSTAHPVSSCFVGLFLPMESIISFTLILSKNQASCCLSFCICLAKSNLCACSTPSSTLLHVAPVTLAHPGNLNFFSVHKGADTKSQGMGGWYPQSRSFQQTSDPQ